VNTKRLESLGWKLVEARQVDGHYRIVTESCGHFLICLAGNRNEAMSAICSLALLFTRGDLRLPSGFSHHFCPNGAEPEAGAFAMDDRIREYERLRKVMHELTVQTNTVDARLVEIENQLPNEYKYPGDPPLDDLRLPRPQLP
jgi:hypothetical protein